MATADPATLAQPRFLGLPETQGTRLFLLVGSTAAVLAVMAGIWIWSSQPDYRVLFSNYTDRDGGAIVASLQQMNVPYKFSEGGTAILVPENQVHDARLKLALQGLPKGGNVGFELMENQKMGISQFLEQINFQRALEGELARSIETISAVQSARVHLAIPKDTVFMREQQKPTASVILNLYSSRLLDQQQVSAIIHLVASSVPELPAQNVTIVDQSGNLLSDTTKQTSNGLNPTQLKYVHELQQDIVKRIESIISPIVGPNNVRAEASADVDFTHVEQAAETYKPNQPPETASVRSMQNSESGNKSATNASGIPGSFSNQPPTNATAPIVTGAAAASAAAAANGAVTQKESTINYELDKTVRYTQLAMGGIKRLAVGVVVNFKHEIDKNGKPVNRELNDAEKAQITSLAKEAMGFSQERGDTLNVVNSQFISTEKDLADVPFWKQPATIELIKNILKYLAGAIAIMYLFFGYLKPLLRKIMDRNAAREREEARYRATPNLDEQLNEDGSVVNLSKPEVVEEFQFKAAHAYEKDLEVAQNLAKQDPKIVANVVKTWVNSE
ncbi:flagellar basal-body MS-ring/collar protein FliF [Solimicrobium silvestre]|uniref:Flagellar M-ring protein n=1 Tax=Solimicrobium silvestre TaxID=2099400 RepID=A0A2S9GST1_9BURK|nr:flagellar basal-body MS-ring/collar protein FliF [Solimicrobium silvestre]PRC90777.1 fliF: flagellar M-ring protein FliF [Solimicrobium silvestre]